jgi:hypothetical protein
MGYTSRVGEVDGLAEISIAQVNQRKCQSNASWVKK